VRALTSPLLIAHGRALILQRLSSEIISEIHKIIATDINLLRTVCECS
jgi:hypothetical protein